MKCLLVSDTSIEQTAVLSLTLEGGSLMDPKEIPELAYLCQKTLTARSTILSP
jgi:secreted Zn-dependent insulinase-like peptidase